MNPYSKEYTDYLRKKWDPVLEGLSVNALSACVILESEEYTPLSKEDLHIIKKPVLVLDTPNKNGRIYPRAVFEAALKRSEDAIKNRRLLVFPHETPFSEGYDLTKAVGVVTELSILNNTLFADYELFPQYASLAEMPARTAGIGTVNTSGEVNSDYEITAIILTPTPA